VKNTLPSLPDLGETNETFYNILNHFSLQVDAPAEVRDLIKAQMTTTFNEMTDGQQDDLGLL